MSEFKFDTKIICPEDPTADKKRIEQYKEYYKVKYAICKEQNPKKIVEIGVRAGYSAWTFMQSCPESKYIGLDANNGTHGGQGGTDKKFMKWARNILKDYNAEIREVDTQKETELDFVDVDFFHVDGDHTTKGVYHDLNLAFKTLSKGGMILVDDIDYIKEVKQGVTSWLKDNKDKIRYEFRPSLRGECLIWKT
jgi:predicted O-methyltransferase YrrM